MSQILVTHPGRQHAHQLARALYDLDALAGFWTGVPSSAQERKGPLYRRLVSLSPQPTLELPPKLTRHFYVVPIVRRLTNLLCTPGRAVTWQHRAMAWFDRWCARKIPTGIDAVVCYENAALRTFQEAKEHGTTTILDAASVHHQRQDDVYDPAESDEAHARINDRKDREIEQADHILTVSELARESYIAAGVSENKVTAVPMGADLSDFEPPSPLRTPSEAPLTFLFVGHVGRRKGADVLLAASRLLQTNGVSHCIRFAGEREERFQDVPDTVEWLGYLSRDELVEAYQHADVLVLPSRHDSFGRVVAEGMATGLPALVSEEVGAKEVLTKEESGWVVSSGNPDTLAAQMCWCVEHPSVVASMQESALEAAQNYTWQAYRRRVGTVIQRILS